MAIVSAVVHVAAAAGVATDQTFTGAGAFADGNSPKAAIFFATKAATDGTATTHAAMCVGFATSAASADNHSQVTGDSEDASAISDAGRRSVSAKCITIPTGLGGIDASAAFKAWAADGVTVTWDAALTANYMITVVLIAEDGISTDLTAHAGVAISHATVGSSVNLTSATHGLTFEPDLLFVFNNFQDRGDIFGNFILSLGACVNDGSLTQGSVSGFDRDGESAEQLCAGVATATYVSGYPWSTGDQYTQLEVTAFSDTTNFATITTRTDNQAAGQSFSFLALNFGGAKVPFVKMIDTPTTADAADAHTTAGVDPDNLILFGTHVTALDTVDITGLQVMSLGIGASDGSVEGSCSAQSEDAAGTSNTQSMTDSKIMNLPEGDGTDGYICTLASLDAGGFTLNFSTNVPAAAAKWLAVGWGDAAAAGGLSIPVAMHNYRRRRA